MDACYLLACHGVIVAMTVTTIIVDQAFKHEASLTMLCFWYYSIIFQVWAYSARHVWHQAHWVEAVGFLLGFLWTIVWLMNEFTLFQTWFIMSGLAYTLSVCIRGRRCIDALDALDAQEQQAEPEVAPRMPPLTLLYVVHIDTAEKPSCAICLDTVESEAWAQTQACQIHRHHAACLEQWQRTSVDRRCPLCRV